MIKKGDKVEVTDIGQIYSMAPKLALHLNASNYIENKYPESLVFKVVDVKPHRKISKDIVCLLENECGQFLFNIKGVKVIEKPRTRTEYEKVTESIFDLKDEFERGELYIQLLGDGGEYRAIEEESTLIDEMCDDNVYRKVEKPIEWWEDAAEFVKQFGYAENSESNGKLLVEASMTRDQWCDFARILLEQEGE